MCIEAEFVPIGIDMNLAAGNGEQPGYGTDCGSENLCFVPSSAFRFTGAGAGDGVAPTFELAASLCKALRNCAGLPWTTMTWLRSEAKAR